MTHGDQLTQHGPTQAQHRRMHALWRTAGVTTRADRLALTTAVTGRAITTSAQLTPAEADRLITYMTELDQAGSLRDTVARWLSTHVGDSG